MFNKYLFFFGKKSLKGCMKGWTSVEKAILKTFTFKNEKKSFFKTKINHFLV